MTAFEDLKEPVNLTGIWPVPAVRAEIRWPKRELYLGT
jgi:hypothetical protein